MLHTLPKGTDESGRGLFPICRGKERSIPLYFLRPRFKGAEFVLDFTTFSIASDLCYGYGETRPPLSPPGQVYGRPKRIYLRGHLLRMAEDKTENNHRGGPTASGKTEVGIRLAQEFGGEIVPLIQFKCTDTWDVGSAKPTPEERRRAPHHLVDIRDPDEDFSAGDYVEEARKSIKDIMRRAAFRLLLAVPDCILDY